MRALTIADQQIFNQYLSSAYLHWQVQTNFVSPPSAYSFATHYIWRDFYDFFWTTQYDYLCLFARQDGDFFMPIAPFGNRPLEPTILEWVFDFMKNESQRTHISRVENVISFPNQLMGFQVFLTETEYIYCREKLGNLRGNAYKSKRHAINQFQANYPMAQVSIFQSADAPDCLKLYKEWSMSRNKSYVESKNEIAQVLLADSFFAHKQGLAVADQLGLFGLVVRISGRLCAYTLGYALSSAIFCVLFEVADLDYKGLPQFIFQKLCLQRHERWINVMGDSGLSNLKRVKTSYRPDRLQLCQSIKRSDF